MKRALLLIASHIVVGLLGFGAGVYFLPILTAPPAPAAADVEAASTRAMYTGRFRRDLKDSDAFHWNEGTVFVARDAITLRGRVAPGPLPSSIDPAAFNTVVVWCESFGQFITAARYR
jgi:hypothetical protein